MYVITIMLFYNCMMFADEFLWYYQLRFSKGSLTQKNKVYVKNRIFVHHFDSLRQMLWRLRFGSRRMPL